MLSASAAGSRLMLPSSAGSEQRSQGWVSLTVSWCSNTPAPQPEPSHRSLPCPWAPHSLPSLGSLLPLQPCVPLGKGEHELLVSAHEGEQVKLPSCCRCWGPLELLHDLVSLREEEELGANPPSSDLPHPLQWDPPWRRSPGHAAWAGPPPPSALPSPLLPAMMLPPPLRFLF